MDDILTNILYNVPIYKLCNICPYNYKDGKCELLEQGLNVNCIEIIHNYVIMNIKNENIKII